MVQPRQQKEQCEYVFQARLYFGNQLRSLVSFRAVHGFIVNCQGLINSAAHAYL